MTTIDKLKEFRHVYWMSVDEAGIAPEDSILHLLDEAIDELESTIATSVEEIEYALAKPQYADVYLNNVIRFLK